MPVTGDGLACRAKRLTMLLPVMSAPPRSCRSCVPHLAHCPGPGEHAAGGPAGGRAPSACAPVMVGVTAVGRCWPGRVSRACRAVRVPWYHRRLPTSKLNSPHRALESRRTDGPATAWSSSGCPSGSGALATVNELKLRVASGFRHVASPAGQRSTATIAPPGVPVATGAEVDAPLPSRIHWSWPVRRKQEMRPKELASRLASPGVKNAGPQAITPGVPATGPAAAGDDAWLGRLRAACWTARHLALDICPVQGGAGGPLDALERPARANPASAAVTATTMTAPVGLTRPDKARP